MVLNENKINPKITMYLPLLNNCSKDATVKTAPLISPIHRLLIKMTKAVIVQTIKVSISGSSIEIIPCLAGLLVFAAA